MLRECSVGVQLFLLRHCLGWDTYTTFSKRTLRKDLFETLKKFHYPMEDARTLHTVGVQVLLLMYYSKYMKENVSLPQPVGVHLFLAVDYLGQEAYMTLSIPASRKGLSEARTYFISESCVSISS